MAEPRDDELRARYRALATEEPSAALDDAIRAAARRAVASAPGAKRRSPAQRWAVPVSLAAVLFLSFGVVMHMQQEAPSVESELRIVERAAQPAPSKPSVVTEDIARDKPSEVAIAPMQRSKEKKAVDERGVAGIEPGPGFLIPPRGGEHGGLVAVRR